MSPSVTQSDSETPRTTWPGHRDPTFTDAEAAYRPISESQMDSFKRALTRLPLAVNVEYISDDANPLLMAELSPEPLHYPMPPLLSQTFENHGFTAPEIADFVKLCSDRFVSQTPFLRDIPVPQFYPPSPPYYFTLAMACMGSMLRGLPTEKSADLWRSSWSLMCRQLEVDNREARRPELIKAWVILETYGLLSCDRLVWDRTFSAHGYVETAVWRLLDEIRVPTEDYQHNNISLGPIDNLKSSIEYFVLVDLLRSVHFGQTSTFASPEVISIVCSPSQARPEQTLNQPYLDSNNLLMELIGLLSGIHTLAMVFRPLLRDPRSTTSAPSSYPSTHIPFSSASELEDMTTRLQQNLQLWADKYLETAGPEVTLLYHFSQIYLVLPDLQALIDRCGYTPRSTTTVSTVEQTSIRPKTSGPVDSPLDGLEDRKLACDHAWRAMTVLSKCRDTSQAMIWKPLAIFSAALSIWADISLESTVGSPASVMVLHLFETELANSPAPCAGEMSTVLARLRASNAVLPKTSSRVPVYD